MSLLDQYPHLIPGHRLPISGLAQTIIGEVATLMMVMAQLPILPADREKLLRLTITKGAQATTAIEGNTLTDEEVNSVYDKKKLPESRETQAKEVANMVAAVNDLFQTVKRIHREKGSQHLVPQVDQSMVREMHKVIGKDLGEAFESVPGLFRTHAVAAGGYKFPAHEDVPALMDWYFEWINDLMLSFSSKRIHEFIVAAILAHGYFVQIHPFGDGNGRSARIVEFYILCMAGAPPFTLHLLSNHYNGTRNEYYRHLQKAAQTRDWSEFVLYALIGLRDGLIATFDLLKTGVEQVFWHHHIYEMFEGTEVGSKTTLKRRRQLALDLPPGEILSIEDAVNCTPAVARAYATSSKRTIERDITMMVGMDIMKRPEKGKVAINVEKLTARHSM